VMDFQVLIAEKIGDVDHGNPVEKSKFLSEIGQESEEVVKTFWIAEPVHSFIKRVYNEAGLDS
jgi:hypothetical protein